MCSFLSLFFPSVGGRIGTGELGQGLDLGSKRRVGRAGNGRNGRAGSALGRVNPEHRPEHEAESASHAQHHQGAEATRPARMRVGGSGG